MKELYDSEGSLERLQVRCRITGSVNGIHFTYEDPVDSDGSQFIWVEDNDPSSFWWTQGNMACDCNRYKFVPSHLRGLLDNDKEDGDVQCGTKIIFHSIEPLEGKSIPTLFF